jgi:hypothetical protein
MMQSLADLPPIVIADLFGIAPGTTHRWAQFAGNSWSDYLAALPDTAPAASAKLPVHPAGDGHGHGWPAYAAD